MGSPKNLSKIHVKILYYFPNFIAYSSLFIIIILTLRYSELRPKIILFKPMIFRITITPSNYQHAIQGINYEKNQEMGNGGLQNKSEVLVHEDQESCNIFDGKWVADDSRLGYEPGSCPFIDDGFNCFKNGRPDSNYTKWRWQPKSCDLPRIDGKKMLGMLRGKRIAFVGDSLNRNMWESLVCILRNSIQDKSRVYEVSGRKEYKTENFYAFRFTDYNCSIEFFRSSFLVKERKFLGENGIERDSLRLDTIESSSNQYKDADVLIFNTGHWWTHEKTSQGKDYYQEGNHVHSQLSADDAIRKAMQTWARWVNTNIDTTRTRVFFRGYSSSHFGGGKWNKGGNCDGETLPVTGDTRLKKARKLVDVVESVIGGMRNPVGYLNVTRMTDYRKDAHPSKYGMVAGNQDCSHWCLPGVPDVWNEMLYAMLLRKL